MSSTKTKTRDQQQLRLRVFAGPNGSGKSTVIRFNYGIVVHNKEFKNIALESGLTGDQFDYYRSLDLLYDACQLSYQVFLFDNSAEDAPLKMFAHFKKNGDRKVWDKMNKKEIPNWFRKYHSQKISQ